MREIKFRVWAKQNPGEMTFFPEMKFDFETGKLATLRHTEWEGDSEPENWTPAVDGYADSEEFELMQYTGLKDKNGKEIYEGDIVRAKDYRTGAYLIGNQPQAITIIEWSGNGYYLTGQGRSFNDGDCEIIGNIHETPELLNPERKE